MTYQPNPTVTIDGGLDFTNEAIASISINLGRRDVLEQPQPGFARVELFTDADTPLDVELSDPLIIKIDKGTTGQETIFNGTISDIEIGLAAFGEIGSLATYTITAVGPFALLNRRIAGTLGYSKEYDGTRILNILTEAFLTEWDDLAPTLTWNQLPVGVTWATYDGTNEAIVADLATSIDTPGVYELIAEPADGTNALTLAQQAAASGRGVLWENADGGIHYDDYASRALETPVPLTADEILAGGINVDSKWGEIVNDITLTYKANASKQVRDEQSITLYGQLAATKDTILENGADALTQANDYLESRAFPRTYPDQYTIALHNPQLTDAKIDTFAAVYCGMRVATDELPKIFGTTFDGFVEGWTWNLTRYTANLTIYCSAYSETYSSIVWYQIPPTTTWAGYNPIVKWSDL